MAAKFPSDEWTKAFGDALNNKGDYRTAAKNWRAGVVALIVTAAPEVGINADYCIFLDVHEGQCREARACSLEEAQKQPFSIRAEYGWWKSVIRGELEPVKGLITGKLKLKGDLATIVRNIGAARSMARTASLVETVFPDEK